MREAPTLYLDRAIFSQITQITRKTLSLRWRQACILSIFISMHHASPKFGDNSTRFLSILALLAFTTFTYALLLDCVAESCNNNYH
ncbi:hypothetical protein BDN70DRAFT_874045, partial [Pholiota conissans]